MARKIAKEGSLNFEKISLLQKRFKETGLIILLGLSIYTCLALIYYDSSDPCWSNATSNFIVKNSTGILGAWVSDILFFILGYVAYFVPVTLFLSATTLILGNNFKEYKPMVWILRIIGFSFVIISLCGLFSVYFQAGGIIGSLIKSNLLNILNYLGLSLFLLINFLIGMTLMTGLSWFYVLEHLGKITIIASKLIIMSIAFISGKTVNFIRNIKNKYQARKAARRANKAKENFSKPVIQNSNTNTSLSLFKNKKKSFLEPGSNSEIKTITVKQPKFSGKKIKANDLEVKLDLSLLEEPKDVDISMKYSKEELEKLSKEVETRLLEFQIEVRVVSVCPGPVITRFELDLSPGIKASRVTGLSTDLARSLLVKSVRVVEVIPGKPYVGLEIPNQSREIVALREILESEQYQKLSSPLTMALGKDIAGVPVAADLAKMPHLLVAGTTGSGKSVGVNTMLLSLLYKSTPEQVRLVLIDPKMLELSIYDGIPHLLTPVVTDMKDAANALRWCVGEMERRYKLMAALGVRNITGFNEKVKLAKKSGNPILDPLHKELNPTSIDEPEELEELPYIVVIIDEFADLIMVVGKKVEELIARIAQKARAAGINMILATQRPSVDVITGLIKANVPTRISYQVSSRIDSRTILDQQGAEQLLGHGDMLYLAPGTGVPIRIHGAFVSDEEVHSVVSALKADLEPPNYIFEAEENIAKVAGIDKIEEQDAEADPLYDEAVAIVIKSKKASISYLQRRLKVGYNRAARMIENMETVGIVSQIQSNGQREVIHRGGSE